MAPDAVRGAADGVDTGNQAMLLSSANARLMTSFLNQHVLVLNRLWQAVNICTARRALTLLFQGHAEVVLEDQDGSFRLSTLVSGTIYPGRSRIRSVSAPSHSGFACRE
jgi:hypothetical protein